MNFQSNLSFSVSKEDQRLAQLYGHRILTIFRNCLDNFYDLDEMFEKNMPKKEFYSKLDQTKVSINSFNLLMQAMKSEIKNNSYLREEIESIFLKQIRPKLNKLKGQLCEFSQSGVDALEAICKDEIPQILAIKSTEITPEAMQKTMKNYGKEQEREEYERELVLKNGKFDPSHYWSKFEKDEYEFKKKKIPKQSKGYN